MNALKQYYEYVSTLDELLEFILDGNLIDRTNLRSVFKDVVLAASQQSIQQFCGKIMTKCNLNYEKFILKIGNQINQNNAVFKFSFNKQFFLDSRFEYLYYLVGEDYFLFIMRCFAIYKMDSLLNCYLQFGNQLIEENRLKEKKRMINKDRLFVQSNQQFIEINLQLIGNFTKKATNKFVNKFNENNEIKVKNELRTIYKFYQDYYPIVDEFINNLNQNPSHLINPMQSIKLLYYEYNLGMEFLDKDQIYENQLDFDECKSKFLNQFQNVDQLFNAIFNDNLIKSEIYQLKLDKILFDYLNSFINLHRKFDFDAALEQECSINEINSNFENNISNGLSKFTRQDEISNYLKKVLNAVLPIQLFGKENRDDICRFFSLLFYQNSRIKIYYSNLYLKFSFQKVIWLDKKNYRFRIHVIHYLIKWLSRYVIDLINFSFLIIEEPRLKSYRSSYWIKLRNSQIKNLNEGNIIAVVAFDNEIMQSKKYDFIDCELNFKTNCDSLEISSVIDNNPNLKENFEYASKFVI